MSHSCKPPTLLVTGGTGFLGSRILSLASSWETHATFHSTQPPSSSTTRFYPCDLRNFEQVDLLLKTLNPDVIIHTAASNHTPQNLDSIVPSATNLATLARQYRIRLLHISSDMVFDGTKAPYSEDDPPSPLTSYGYLKAEAESQMATHHPESLIVRTSLIYGTDSPLDHQTQWLLNGIKKREPVRLFTDEWRCPIWVDTFSLAVLELARHSYRGILHVAGPQLLSRWEFGQALLNLLHETRTEYLTPSTSQASGLLRPSNLALNIIKAQRLLDTPLLSIAEVTALLHSKV